MGGSARSRRPVAACRFAPSRSPTRRSTPGCGLRSFPSPRTSTIRTPCRLERATHAPGGVRSARHGPAPEGASWPYRSGAPARPALLSFPQTPGSGGRAGSLGAVPYEFKLPDLGEGLTEGEVARWLVAEGDEIAEDQPLVEIQTDKTTVEIPSPAAGTVTQILVADGDVVPVGTVLVVIGGDGGLPGRVRPAGPAPPPDASRRGTSAGRVQATPLVRRIAAELGVDLATRRADRARRADHRGRCARRRRRRAPRPEGRREKLRGVRRQIAEHLTRAHREIPAVTFVEECDFSASTCTLLLPTVLRATALSLREFPELNARLEGDEIVYLDRYDLGIAVQTEQGLVVPGRPRLRRAQSSTSCAPTSTSSPRGRAPGRSSRGGPARLDLHRHERRQARRAPRHAADQLTRGRDPRRAPDLAAPGRPRRRGRRAPDREHQRHLRPPRRRRRPGGRLHARRHRPARVERHVHSWSWGTWYTIGLFAGLGAALGVAATGRSAACAGRLAVGAVIAVVARLRRQPLGAGGRRRRRRRSAARSARRRSSPARCGAAARAAARRPCSGSPRSSAPGSRSSRSSATSRRSPCRSRAAAAPPRARHARRAAHARARLMVAPKPVILVVIDGLTPSMFEARRHAGAALSRRARRVPPRRVDVPVADARLPGLDRDRRASRTSTRSRTSSGGTATRSGSSSTARRSARFARPGSRAGCATRSST